jgi:GNAT superfamily N-acetyltransferase
MGWFQNSNRHFWVAYHEGKPVGQFRIQPDGETFISEHPDVMNVTSTYVTDVGRHTGIGLMLLAEVQCWLQDNGHPLCGVDFESFNVPGSKFWNRHFTPYTYSLVRRIDERIL